MHRLAAFELGEDAVTVLVEANVHHLLAQPEYGTELPKLEAQALDDLAIGKVQQHRTLVQQRDLHSQRGEHRRILQADDAGAHDDQLARQLLQAVHLVGVEDAFAVDRDLRIVRGPGSAGDDEVLATQQGVSAVACDFDRVIVDEPGVAFVNRHPVATQLRLDDLDLARHHRVGTKHQVLHRDVVFQGVAAAVERSLPQAAEVQDGLAQRLAGNGAGVDANSADAALALDHGHFLAQLRGADRGFLSGGTATDYHQVVGAVAGCFHHAALRIPQRVLANDLSDRLSLRLETTIICGAKKAARGRKLDCAEAPVNTTLQIP